MTVTLISDSDNGDKGTGDDDNDIEGKSHQLSSTTRIKNNEQVKIFHRSIMAMVCIVHTETIKEM